MDHLNGEAKFLSLLEEHKKIIYKICHFYCRYPANRQDLSQEIIIELWKAFSRYDSQYKFSTWMYRIALNVAISFYRTGKNKTHIVSVGEHFIDIAEEPAHTPARETNLHLLNEFINRLDEFNKALMVLYLDDYSYKEMAAVLGISETNVATKINRIKQKLKLQFNTP